MSELQDLFEQGNPIPKGITRCGDHYAQTEYMLIDPYASNYAARFKGFMEGVRHQQAIIDNLKTQLNNMEACYIALKKERDDEVYLKDQHRKRRCQLAKELTQKSLRLTDAEFEYKRIKELQAKDCLQIMRLTARNEKLSDELKALRGEHE